MALSNGLDTSCREENLESLNIAKSSGDLLLSIIQDILDLSKIEAGQLEVQNDDVFSITEIVNSTRHLADAIITQKQKGIRFACKIDPALHDSIAGDPFRLQQIINNLISSMSPGLSLLCVCSFFAANIDVLLFLERRD